MSSEKNSDFRNLIVDKKNLFQKMLRVDKFLSSTLNSVRIKDKDKRQPRSTPIGRIRTDPDESTSVVKNIMTYSLYFFVVVISCPVPLFRVRFFFPSCLLISEFVIFCPFVVISLTKCSCWCSSVPTIFIEVISTFSGVLRNWYYFVTNILRHLYFVRVYCIYHKINAQKWLKMEKNLSLIRKK